MSKTELIKPAKDTPSRLTRGTDAIRQMFSDIKKGVSFVFSLKERWNKAREGHFARETQREQQEAQRLQNRLKLAQLKAENTKTRTQIDKLEGRTPGKTKLSNLAKRAVKELNKDHD